MKKKVKNNQLLFVTEDFPSGLNGNSVRTRNTLIYLLDQGYNVDLCCFHFDEFKKVDFKHKNLKVFFVNISRFKKLSINFLINSLNIILSPYPVSLRRLFSENLKKKILLLQNKNDYSTIFFDGYSTLQYLNKELSDNKCQKIYIDDEDFTDLFKQRLILETKLLVKIFYLHEYLKSLLYEKLFFSRLDQIWAISPNTKTRFEKITRVKTVVMPTIISLKENLYQGDGYNLVFTGTLNWRENVEGLKWFISTHWAEICCYYPKAKLTVIGQGASKEFISYLNLQKNIFYKGYVESLENEYKKASLSIAPVRINAGIKVKILTYMSYGLPVISTKKASLGLVSTNGILVSSDKHFSRFIITMLENKRMRKLLSRKAHNNIKKNYSITQLESFLAHNFVTIS